MNHQLLTTIELDGRMDVPVSIEFEYHWTDASFDTGLYYPRCQDAWTYEFNILEARRDDTSAPIPHQDIEHLVESYIEDQEPC